MSNVDHLIGKKVMPDSLALWCQKAMVKSGLSESDASIAADVFVAADTRGIFSHGSRQIFPLMKNVKSGRIDPRAVPVKAVDRLSVAILDGKNAMPTTIAVEAMKLAVQKAKNTGMGYVGVRYSNHIGALSYYPLLAAAEGLIGLAMTNTNPWVTVPGGKGPVMGTNPICYAIPTGNDQPIFLDIATSSVAVTRILSLKALGKKLPEKWLVDEHGNPTDDPADFPEKGALLPMGMHKGYGLALLVETLAAMLSGSAFLSGIPDWLNDSPEPVNQGQAFIALDIASLLPKEEFYQNMRKMTAEILDSPKADNAGKIMLPGGIEHEKRKKAFAEGLFLPDYVLVNLLGLAESAGELESFNSLFRAVENF
jgi:ureidoglycolate dehydrogenase (NAD+)